MSISLDSDRIASLLLWDNGKAIDYSEEDIARHGLTTTYEVICDNYSDECEVEFYDIDGDEFGIVSVEEIRGYLYGVIE